jgi:macrolide-specific efflux system membrane fusion protein
MRKLLVAAATLAAAGAAVVVFGWAAGAGRSAGEGTVETVRVARRDVGAVVKATGVIKPMIGAEVRVGSRISGVVRRLFVRVGDTVPKGHLLAELDARELEARRNEAVASLQLAQGNLSYAAADLERKRELAAAALIARSELDLAERAHTVAEQQVTQAQANLEFATTQLEYARIVAPIAGVVASVSTQEGETVAASFATPTFVTLLDLSRLEVWAYVDETDIGRVRTGQPASFTVDTYGDHAFEGRVTAVYPQAQIRDNVVNYVTVVRFRPPRDRTLRPEMTATVRIALERRPAVLALPVRAVRREAGRAFVLLPRGGSPERRWVTTGLRDERYWEIVDGLREGEDVVVGEAGPPRER